VRSAHPQTIVGSAFGSGRVAPEQPLVGAGSNQKSLEECHDWKAGWPAFGVASHALGIHGQYLFVDAEQQLVVAKVSSKGGAARSCAHNLDATGCIGVRARPGGLALAPNGHEPRLPMPRQPRRAVVMAHLHEAYRDDVIAPSIEIEEAAIALVGKALLVISSGV